MTALQKTISHMQPSYRIFRFHTRNSGNKIALQTNTYKSNRYTPFFKAILECCEQERWNWALLVDLAVIFELKKSILGVTRISVKAIHSIYSLLSTSILI